MASLQHLIDAGFRVEQDAHGWNCHFDPYEEMPWGFSMFEFEEPTEIDAWLECAELHEKMQGECPACIGNDFRLLWWFTFKLGRI